MLRVLFFQVHELVNSPTPPENVVGANEHDILFLEVAVGFSLVQCFRVTQRLVVTGALRQFVGVLDLHLDVKGAEDFALWSPLLYKYIVADPLVKGAAFGRFLRLRFLQVKNWLF